MIATYLVALGHSLEYVSGVGLPNGKRADSVALWGSDHHNTNLSFSGARWVRYDSGHPCTDSGKALLGSSVTFWELL